MNYIIFNIVFNIIAKLQEYSRSRQREKDFWMSFPGQRKLILTLLEFPDSFGGDFTTIPTEMLLHPPYMAPNFPNPSCYWEMLEKNPFWSVARELDKRCEVQWYKSTVNFLEHCTCTPSFISFMIRTSLCLWYNPVLVSYFLLSSYLCMYNTSKCCQEPVKGYQRQLYVMLF